MPTPCRSSSGVAWRRIPSASSIRRSRRWRRSSQPRRRPPTGSATRARPTSPPSAPTSTRIGVAYRIEPALVRGLDYYTRTAFEFYRRGAEGQQQALGGGGRYDGLVALLGGKPTPGIGFALGLDRVVLALESAGAAPAEESTPIAVVVGADPSDTSGRLAVATRLRDAGLAVRADLSQRRLGRQLEAAVKEGSRFAVILGEERSEGDVQLRDLDAGSQKLVPLADLAALLRRKTPGA